MCGVVSIIYQRDTDSMGKLASSLLQKLEYRGYDSTGGAFITQEDSIVLKKKVGAPSEVIQELDFEKESSRKFIGQVRWATYGAVTDNNSQPHDVSCHAHIIGAHNGNISNTDSLKEFLLNNDHKLLSDNDGEMLLHTVEHYYAELLKNANNPTSKDKITLLTEAICLAQKKIIGCYAACLTIPGIDGVFAIKSGSSLYAGKGYDENGEFIIVCSDLNAVLSQTRFLIPLKEGEGIYFNHASYHTFSLSDGEKETPIPSRSKLNAEEISLNPNYRYFMEQEIFAAPDNIEKLKVYYLEDHWNDICHKIFEDYSDTCKNILIRFAKLYDIIDIEVFKREFIDLITDKKFQEIFKLAERPLQQLIDRGWSSEDNSLLLELKNGFAGQFTQELKIINLMSIWKKKRSILKYKSLTIELFKKCKEDGGRVFLIASGSSYHASLIGGYLFNSLAQFSIIPTNPGTFRSLYMSSINPKDIIVGISQSGETKDLIDIYNDISSKDGSNSTIISIVNNENSTIPQEKSDYYLPILSGPEIAVAATKSFVGQITLFYILAQSMTENDSFITNNLDNIHSEINEYLKIMPEYLDEIASKLYISPSLHILGTTLIGLAKEGALKIREVVINHTEGYDCAEFKHGPNTILGHNTIFSLKDLEKAYNISNDDLGVNPYDDKLNHLKESFSNYPLLFICPPDERDKRITISQIHTHKIRGADIVLLAEEDEELRKAIEGVPQGDSNYYHRYISLPKTGNKLSFLFKATIALQYIAFKMSVYKMDYLDTNEIKGHGVHPDAPKNVSKSITVD